MKITKLIIAAALGTTALAGIGIAAAVTPHGMMRADTNGDGTVSRAEFFAKGDTRFKRLDANSDGTIGTAEFRGPRLARADANGDGAVTKSEFAAQEDTHFKRIDSNGDKQISEAELQAAHAQMRGRHRGPGGFGGPHAMMRGGPGGGPMGGRMFERTDANHDNRISRDEVRAQADTHFATLDANHDGFVDKPEIAARHQQMRAKFQAMHDGMAPPPPPPAAPNPVQ